MKSTSCDLDIYAFYKTNMLLLYYIISPIPEPSMTFSVSHMSQFVTYVTITCDIMIVLLSKSKI